MRHIFRYLFIVSVVLMASCKKEDTSIFDKPTDVRIEEVTNSLSNVLVGAKDGWKATLYTKGGGGYSFWIKFDNNNRVKMYSDFDTSTATIEKESSYRLKALQQPTLIFDTYSYIHLLTDPDGNVNGGTNGIGLTSDFEFYLDKNAIKLLKSNPNTDTLDLVGRYNETTLHLEKASSAESSEYAAGDLADVMNAIADYLKNNPNLYLQFADGNKIQVSIDDLDKTIDLNWITDNQVEGEDTKFAFSLIGASIEDTLMYNDQKILSFVWDKSVNKIAVVLVDGTKQYLQNSATPIIPIYFFLGSGFNEVYLPFTNSFPGWSSDFLIRRGQANTNMYNSPYSLDLGEIDFLFNSDAKTVKITVAIYQGSSRFLATFPYSYSMTPDGKFKFTPEDGRNGNANLILDYMKPLFAERLDTDTFQMDYYVDPTEGTLAMFSSIEHPDFAFTGYK